MEIKNILFWVFIAIIVGTALWLLHGSPPEMNAIISIGLAVAGSELLIWKTLFKTDKNTAVGFTKVKAEFKNINDKLNEISKKLDK
jgi:hypothetical protein